MVALEAPSPPPDLPALSPEDSALLDRYWSHGEDLAAIANNTGQTRMALLAWTLHPDVRAWITARRRHEDDLNLRLAINTLAALVRTSDDPVEKRRAASVMLRAYTTPLPRGEGAASAAGEGLRVQQRPVSSHAGEGAASAAGEGLGRLRATARATASPPLGAASRASVPTPDDIDALEDREADEGPDAVAPNTQDSALRTQDSSPSTQDSPLPAPPGTPELSRDTTPAQIAAWTLAALANPATPTPDAYQHALYNLLGYDAKARTAEAVHDAAQRALSRSGVIPGFLSCDPGPVLVGEAGSARQESLVTLITGQRIRLRLTLHRGYTPALDPCWHLRFIQSTPINEPSTQAPSPAPGSSAPSPAPGGGGGRPAAGGGSPSCSSSNSSPAPDAPDAGRGAKRSKAPTIPTQDSALSTQDSLPKPLRLIHPTPLSDPDPRRPSATFAFQPGFGNTS